MAIFTRWGDEVRITADCGEHDVDGFRAPVHLVQVVKKASGELRYNFIIGLRADEGINEILARVNDASAVELTGDELEAAITQAM